MKVAGIALFVLLSGFGFFSLTQSRALTSAPHPPVLVELFTSEGCSSCPPADRLLIELNKQSRPDAEIVVLSEHVDYWNYIGWKDPYSSRQFSDRQSQYARWHGTDEVFTPQMVVDGGSGFTGSDSGAAKREIERAAQDLKTAVLVEPLSVRIAAVRLRLTIGKAKPAELFLAVTEDELQNNVIRGENSGRTLIHAGVARLLRKVQSTDGRAVSIETQVPIDPSWRLQKLRVVAFLQGGSGEIFGVGSARLK